MQREGDTRWEWERERGERGERGERERERERGIQIVQGYPVICWNNGETVWVQTAQGSADVHETVDRLERVGGSVCLSEWRCHHNTARWIRTLSPIPEFYLNSCYLWGRFGDKLGTNWRLRHPFTSKNKCQSYLFSPTTKIVGRYISIQYHHTGQYDIFNSS